jgi:protein arginine kinase activator
MMQCQSCKQNTATIHLTEIVDGRRNETHLCESCAQQQGVTVKAQIPLNELLGSLLAAHPETGSAIPQTPEQSCPHCGMTFEKFRQSSLLGCPYDYEVFNKQLAPLIEKSHAGHTEHRGKIPARTPADERKQLELLRLRQELEAALKAEDYEVAAELRDKIKQITEDR